MSWTVQQVKENKEPLLSRHVDKEGALGVREARHHLPSTGTPTLVVPIVGGPLKKVYTGDPVVVVVGVTPRSFSVL